MIMNRRFKEKKIKKKNNDYELVFNPPTCIKY